MELNKINSSMTNWGAEAANLNENFDKVSTAIEQVKNATIKCKGYFSSESALKLAIPTAAKGDKAYVGNNYPYQIWIWNGNSWGDSGSVGGEESVNLGNYHTKEYTDAKLSELGSEVGFLKLEIGGISGANGSETGNQTNRVRTGFLTTPATIELNEGYSTVVILRYDKDKNFVENTGTTNLGILEKENDYLYRVSFKRTDDQEFTSVDGVIKSYSLGLNRLVNENKEKLGNIETRVETIEEELPTINSSLNNTISNLKLSIDILLEQGGISGGGVESNSTTRVRTNLFKAPLKYELNEGFSLVVALRYTSNGEFDKGLDLSKIDNTISTYGDGYLYRIIVKKTDNSDISPADNIFKYISVGDNAIVSENRDKIIASEKKIERNISSINQLYTNDELVLSTLDVLEMKGYAYQSYKLTELNILDNGNIGLPIEERTSTDATQFYTINPTYQNKGNYAVAAAVFTGLEDVSKVGTTASFALSLNFNYGKNANFSNIIEKGVITLDDSSVLVYHVSGRIESVENKLPSTAYARLAKSNTLKFGVSKMLVLELDEWNDKYIDIIVGNATNSSVWTEISSLKLFLPKKAGRYLERNLFSGIAFWGSSSTEGSWVKNVASNLNMPYYWGGVGGENIWAIIGRMGVLPLRIPTSFTIPASKDVPVQIPESYQLKVKWKGIYKNATVWVSSSVRNNKLLVNPCYIAGVKGNLIGSGSSNGLEPLQFQRLEDGKEVTTKAYEPIYTLGFRETRDCVWFLACHFNGGQSSTEELVELYRKMYDVSCSKKVLILGRHKVANGVVTSPTLETLQEQEEALEDEFGLMFFNTREYMCGRGFERFKELYPSNYTQTDIEQAAQGITPDCMYVEPSNVHFNDKGYVVLTEAITQRLIELGYNLFRYGGDMEHPQY